MSGGTDRREDEQVPQILWPHRRKIAEWETDVRLWQVVSERFARTAENHGENKARNTRCCTIHSG